MLRGCARRCQPRGGGDTPIWPQGALRGSVGAIHERTAAVRRPASPPAPAAPPTPTALDNLTHALVGAAIAKAGAERATPLATATLVVAANAPDIDISAFLEGPYFALAARRGITHGIPAMVVLPFMVTAAVLAWDRWIRRRRDRDAEPARAGPLLVLATIGLLTHPVLDWMNTYGMRWWLPFSGDWTYRDALFIIDPWIWLGLGGAVFLASRPGRWGVVGWSLLAAATTALLTYGAGAVVTGVWVAGLATIVAIRVFRGAAGPIGPVTVVLVGGAVVAYILLMVGADALARRQVRSAAEGAGLTVEDVMVAPVPGNPLRAEVEVRTPDAYVPGVHRWVGGPQVELDAGAAVPRLSAPPDLAATERDAVLAAARERHEVRDYLVWSRYPHVRVTADGTGWVVRFGDARYDDRPEAGSLSGVTVHVPAAEIR